MRKLLCTLLMPVATCVGASEIVSGCDLGGTMTKHIDIVRGSEIADTHIYYVREGNGTRPFFDDLDASRGSNVRVLCAGRKQHALVVTGEFSANFLQGFVLIHNAATGDIERLDFAEKSRPAWLYLGASETLVVVPTHGYGETNKKYVVYRHVTGATADMAAVGMDRLPAAGRFEVVKLDKRKEAK